MPKAMILFDNKNLLIFRGCNLTVAINYYGLILPLVEELFFNDA